MPYVCEMLMLLFSDRGVIMFYCVLKCKFFVCLFFQKTFLDRKDFR